MSNKIAIITINLNNIEGLKKTISSVFNQIFTEYEYIVIDGNSTDGSAEYISQYEDRLKYWVSEPDTGVYNAMNKGIRKSEAEYLLFLNSGDVLFSNDILQKVVKELDSTDIVYGDLRFDHGDSFVDFNYPDRLTFGYFNERSLGHPATFIRRKLLEGIGGYDEKFRICADWAFFIRSICLHKASYKHISLLVSVFNTDGMSSISENQQKIREEMQEVLNDDFLPFMDEYITLQKLRHRMAFLESSRIFRFLKYFKVKEFR